MGDEPEVPPEGKVYKWRGRTPEYQAKRAVKAAHRRDARKDSKRPGWWSPEGLLERLQSGERLIHVVEQAVKGAGGRISTRALHQDIKDWKGEFEGFADRYRAALNLRSGDQFATDWFDAFYEALEECDGNLKHACAATGVGRGIVEALRDPSNKQHFNRAFADRVRTLEGTRIGAISERYLEHAERGDGDPKVQEKVLASRMPHLHGQKSELKIAGEVTHIHRVEQSILDQTEARRRGLFARREPQALPAAAEPVTIDVTPVPLSVESN